MCKAYGIQTFIYRGDYNTLTMNKADLIAMAKQIVKNRKGQSAKGVVGIVVAVVIIVNLIPIVADQIGSATNLTTAQSTILGLTTTFLVLGVVVLAAKKSGLMG